MTGIDVDVWEPVESDVAVDGLPRWDLFVQAWLRAFEGNTQKAYETDIRQWTAWCEHRRVAPLRARRVVVDDWRQHLLAKLGLKHRSVARKLAAVASLYAYLVQEEVLVSSPAAHVKRPKVDPLDSDTIALTRDQQDELLHLVEERWGFTFTVTAEILLATGMRSEEVLGIDVADVLDAAPPGILDLRITRKGQVETRMPIDDEDLAGRIRDLVGDRAEGQLVAGPTGRRLTYDTLHDRVTKLGGIGSIPKGVTPHAFRATFATLMLEAGVPLGDVRDSMGHRYSTTTEIYQKRRDQRDRIAAVTTRAARSIRRPKES